MGYAQVHTFCPPRSSQNPHGNIGRQQCDGMMDPSRQCWLNDRRSSGCGYPNVSATVGWHTSRRADYERFNVSGPMIELVADQLHTTHPALEVGTIVACPRMNRRSSYESRRPSYNLTKVSLQQVILLGDSSVAKPGD